MHCDSEFRGWGAWHTCDDSTCVYRGWQPIPGAYVEFDREPCEPRSPPTPTHDPPPQSATGLVLAMILALLWIRARGRSRIA